MEGFLPAGASTKTLKTDPVLQTPPSLIKAVSGPFPPDLQNIIREAIYLKNAGIAWKGGGLYC